MPAAGAKGAPKNPRELKDDTNSSREEKQVSFSPAITDLICLVAVYILDGKILMFCQEQTLLS